MGHCKHLANSKWRGFKTKKKGRIKKSNSKDDVSGENNESSNSNSNRTPMVSVTVDVLGLSSSGSKQVGEGEDRPLVDPLANGAKELEMLVLMSERNWAKGMETKELYKMRKAELLVSESVQYCVRGELPI